MEDIISVLTTTIRVSTPLILACLAGLYSERSGIVDIGLEGKLLGSAFGAAVVASVTGSVWLGLMAGIGVSLMFSAVHGLASINFRGNQIISGVALNFLASGLTVFLGAAWFGRGGNTPALSGGARFYGIELPFARELAGVPVIGPIYSGLLSGHTILTYLAFLAVPLTAWVLWRTRFGLRLRAVGENPKALDTAGMSVSFLRYKALAITAVLVGTGGAYLSTAQAASFSREMSSGRGYIALAALIFAKWRPYPALGACLLFGFLEAMQYRLQGVELPLIGAVPTQAMQALPYVLTILLLAGFVGRAIAPKAAGQPYVKER
ncbi:MAG TPA: sugar ABC transporter permease [Pelagibacterium sp.]|jgi:general nucleoside transport system permease protein|uniref:ABC transporter permease n=1 Tax=uncultured Pelagibacterium sp. TaxID=1159875 RepID=UPI000C5A30AE|nr:sugar ABC transporter permease [Pelagibacterium sp.]HCO56018.1 sugar ABC transporter permease [Pelagibacterium sp.]|tara:strand:+ start:22297 stop:23259 length:963 start_codon:yes stop_codon:yes gene_type:complete